MKTGKPIERQGLSTAWERRVARTATVLAAVTLVVSVGLAAALTRAGISVWASLSLAAVITYLVYAGMSRKLRRRRRILAQPFPAEWEAILQREVGIRETLVWLYRLIVSAIRADVHATWRWDDPLPTVTRYLKRLPIIGKFL